MSHFGNKVAFTSEATRHEKAIFLWNFVMIYNTHNKGGGDGSHTQESVGLLLVEQH